MFFLRRAWLTDKQYSQCCFTANSDDGLFCTPCMRRAVNIIKYRISYLNNINRMYNKTVFLICGPAKTISSIWLIDWSLLKHVANVYATNVTTVTMNQDTWEKKIKTQKSTSYVQYLVVLETNATFKPHSFMPSSLQSVTCQLS